MDLRLTKTDTSVLKGIAILAMLVHHLYMGTDNSWLLGQMQVVGKVCVALFVLLSGYGLCVGYQSLTPPTLGEKCCGFVGTAIRKILF